MTELSDYQREEAGVRRAQRVLRLFAGASAEEQERATRRALAILRMYVR